MHSLVIEVFDRLDKKLLDLTKLLRLFAWVEMSDLFLQAESKGKKVTVVSFELADDHMTFKYPARLVPQKQRSKLPVGFGWQDTLINRANTFLELRNWNINLKRSIVDYTFLLNLISILLLLRSHPIFRR